VSITTASSLRTSVTSIGGGIGFSPILTSVAAQQSPPNTLAASLSSSDVGLAYPTSPLLKSTSLYPSPIVTGSKWSWDAIAAHAA
jgi:hypothetical protein